MLKIKKIITGCLLLSVSSLASVSWAEVDSRLGDSLTPLGAEPFANSDKSIPAWSGQSDMAAVKQDKPLFTITAANMEQYKDKLTEGQIALFKRYPETFKMPVYPSRRTAVYPQRIYDNTKKATATAELLADGKGFKGAYDAYPFPVPENGLEALWNHIVRYRGEYIERPTIEAVVERDGFADYGVSTDKVLFNYNQPDGSEAELDNILFYYLSLNDDGSAALVHETQDQVSEPRLAWGYLPGLRRVRRAPVLSYDTPIIAGLRTADDTDMYNGAPDFYNWELKGKKEVFIPYNNQRLLENAPDYEELLTAGHINPEYTRYELHRVWVVDGKLKDGARHIYGQRTLYLDEDSWGAAVVDQYDNRGQLWKVSIAYLANYAAVPTTWTTWDVFHDLSSGRYHVQGIAQQESKKIAFDVDSPGKKQFTPASLRRMGRR
ncbi:DUF1329 domain-containing protein [Parendozoicomonas haliclonae]|uniref:DUF1329 domain-containing protein n=1 Tax=Parendozoicomonas haliclonae TaxID=1960125 RepID=A0A1X7ARK7_9GAMM|nr:DUF1329 domain-containing protein [Parendozoicomonas haliclonae]SMA50865.1 hypothetical protein EHSB41UT_04683 [Parendozoicomonas haliclonae]